MTCLLVESHSDFSECTNSKVLGEAVLTNSYFVYGHIDFWDKVVIRELLFIMKYQQFFDLNENNSYSLKYLNRYCIMYPDIARI